MKPRSDHRWQLVVLEGLPVAIATRCADCPADLELRCLGRARGLMQLTIAAAAVANGRAGASKQIRLSLGGHSERRRALTHRRPRGYTPVMHLAVDDALLDRLSSETVLKISFYGQRSHVGLRGATRPVARVRAACLAGVKPIPKRHCTWSVVVACMGQREAAMTSATALKGALVKARPDGFCVIVTSTDLAAARARAAYHGGYVERSCLP
ncbi:MAG: hypothetical protein ACR2PI_28225 [Hyphomicrobiaceae bacterium]